MVLAIVGVENQRRSVCFALNRMYRADAHLDLWALAWKPEYVVALGRRRGLGAAPYFCLDGQEGCCLGRIG